MSPSSPIAIVDSSLGGLSVVRALREALPGEEIVFLADTARGPYASKSGSTISIYMQELLEQLRLFRPKHVAIACNASAAVVVPGIRKMFPDLSISSIVDAAARSAIELAGTGHAPIIGVIAPEAAIRSKAFERAIHRRRHHARLLLRPTPLLDSIGEEGRDADDPLLKLMIRQYLGPIADRGANVLILASTWYSALGPAISRLMPEGMKVVDSAACCAQDVARRLQAAGLLRGGQPSGALHCLLTDQTPRFAFHAKRLLGRDVESPKVIPLHELRSPEMPIEEARIPA